MKVKLNSSQRDALSWFFSFDNTEGEPFAEDAAGRSEHEFEEVGGQLCLDGAFLHSDGEWGTQPE